MAALLLPALRQARYTANNITCVNQIKQMHLGIINYASDNGQFYPSGLELRDEPTYVHRNNKFELRPLYKDYFGCNLNSIMKCPLTNSWWYNDTTANIEDSSNRYMPYAFYFSLTTNNAVGHMVMKDPMTKLGKRFLPWDGYLAGSARDFRFNLLISDVLIESNSKSVYAATHRARSTSGITSNSAAFDCLIKPEFGNGYGFYKKQVTTANFCWDDGSVKMYNISSTSGEFVKTKTGRGFLLPIEGSKAN